MGRIFDVGTIVADFGLVAWLLWWTWLGCLNPALATAGKHGPPGTGWYRFRLIAVALLVATGIVLALPDAVTRSRALSYLQLVLMIAHVTIGYIGWIALRAFAEWRGERQGA